MCNVNAVTPLPLTHELFLRTARMMIDMSVLDMRDELIHVPQIPRGTVSPPTDAHLLARLIVLQRGTAEERRAGGAAGSVGGYVAVVVICLVCLRLRGIFVLGCGAVGGGTCFLTLGGGHGAAAAQV